jgi:hypothetical protein
MDQLQSIIKSLKKEEIRNFKIFMNRYKKSSEAKIAVLFDYIKNNKDLDSEDYIINELFPDSANATNAYYRLKNRLKTEIEKSLLNLHHNIDDKTSILNFITLSELFSYKSEHGIAVNYLKRAEKIAIENEFFDFLDIIYRELITLSHDYNQIDPLEYIKKRNDNSIKYKLLNQANDAIANIRYTIQNTNFYAKNEDIQVALKRVIEELKIADDIYHLPKVRLKIHICVRDTLLSNRDFTSLENYLIKSYEEFNNDGLFTKSTHRSKLSLITWIVNTLTINKKWDSALEYTELLFHEINKFNKLYYDNFIWTYHQSLISNYLSNNNLDKAIDLLENIKEETMYKGNSFYDYAIHVSLSLAYYYENNFSEAIKTLSVLFQKDIQSKLTNEFLFNIGILEIILHYEANNLDFIEYKVNELKRHHRTLLNSEAYIEEKNFLKIITQLTNKADPFHNQNILNSIKRFINANSNFQLGSRKHIDLAVWLSAKIERTSYYQKLLDKIKAT